jgi:HK97 family phage prohead protease
MLYEVKSILPNSIKDIDLGKREMVGMFSNYETRDLGKDLAHKGMFDKSWKENGDKVALLFEHKTHRVLARSLKLWDDNKGAYHHSKIGNTKFGDSVLEMADAGLLSGHSFGYATVRSRKSAAGRDLLEVKHIEVTVMGGDWPMHPDTPLIAAKKSFEELLKDEDDLNREYKKLSDFCYKAHAEDDILEHLENVRAGMLLEIKKLHQHILDLSTSSTHAAILAPEPQTEGFDVKSLMAVIEIEKQKFLTV